MENRSTDLFTPAHPKGRRAAIVYVLFAAIWILASDQFLEYIFKDSMPLVITRWQTAKGMAFISITAIILLVVARRLTAPGERVRSAFKTIFDSAGIGILVVSTEGRVLHVNPAATTVSGYPSSEVVGRQLDAKCFPDDVPDLLKALQSVAAGTVRTNRLVVRYRCKDTRTLWLRATLSKIESGPKPLIIVTVEDITREHLAEEALRESELRLRRFADAGLLGIAFWDQGGCITHANCAYLQMTGHSEQEVADGRLRIDELLPADFVSSYKNPSLREDMPERITPFEKELVSTNGARLRVLVGGAQFGPSTGDAVAYVLDISALEEAQQKSRDLEEQLRQAHKLHALGRLAGAIAHDMNNLLSIVIGHASLLEADSCADNPMRHRTQQILRATENGAALIRQLLTFSRQQVLQKQQIDLNARVDAACSMLRPLLGERVHLTFTPSREEAVIEADPVQMDQVLFNLVLNARDAMPNGGHITIESSLSEGMQSGSAPANEVCLSVADTGIGMDENVKQQLFEPFFTTKRPGEGTGLGLSTVYGIVSQTGGRIIADSQIGKGSTFNIYLPTATSAAKQHAAPPNASVSGKLNGTVLFAEDGPALRALLREVLQSTGLDVLECVDGRDAIDRAAEFTGRIDLFITDVGMPHVGGIEAAEVIRRTRPDTKVIFISGYMETSAIGTKQLTGASVLLKPFTPRELTQKIREVLLSYPNRSQLAS